MSAAPAKLAALRHLLAERFPAATRLPGRVLPSGLASLDESTGGLPLGAVTEIVCSAPSCGSQLFLGELLAATRRTRTRVALVDATDSFDPASYPPDVLAHLVWVRCPLTGDPARKATPTTLALQVADLLARDANLGLVVLDLRRAPAADLRRITGPQWYRFQRAVEPADLVFAVLTPRPSVPSAQLRLTLDAPHPVAALEVGRPLLSSSLAPALHRQRLPAVLTA